jgi:hypothetical protein
MLRAVSGGGRSAGKSSPWWRQAATLLGLVGLLVTLAFNTLAVRQSAQQDREARETAQISLLTQLNSNATDSERAISETDAPDMICSAPEQLSRHDNASVHAALDYYDYLAWQFNHGRFTVAGSRGFFGARMIDGWRLGRHFLGEIEMRSRYGELERFVRATPHARRGESPCRR